MEVLWHKDKNEQEINTIVIKGEKILHLDSDDFEIIEVIADSVFWEDMDKIFITLKKVNHSRISDAEDIEEINCKDCKYYTKIGEKWGRCNIYCNAVDHMYSCVDAER